MNAAHRIIDIDTWYAQGERRPLGPYQIFVRDRGQGRAVIALHGFPTASCDWQAIAPAIEKNHRLLCLDLLGFGRSDKPFPHQYRIGEQADLVEQLVLESGLSNCHLLAHDYGDSVAAELMARSERGTLRFTIDDIVMFNGGLFMGAYHPLLIQKLLISWPGRWMTRILSKNMLRRSMRRIMCAQQLDVQEIEAYFKLLVSNQGRRVVHSLIQYMRERKIYARRWEEALSHWATPLTLIDGLDDPISGASMVQEFRRRVPQGRVVMLHGVGHYPQLEAPQQVARALDDRLS